MATNESITTGDKTRIKTDHYIIKINESTKRIEVYKRGLFNKKIFEYGGGD